jgi:hypothetical protein
MCITITFTVKAIIKINKLLEATVGKYCSLCFFNVYLVDELNIVFFDKNMIEEMCELVIY